MHKKVNQSVLVDMNQKATQPWRRRWWLRYIVGILLLVVACIASIGRNLAYQHNQAVKAVETAVAELDRTDPGWRLQDIEAARAVVPEGENSAEVIARVKPLLPLGWPPRPLSDLAPQQPQEQFSDEYAELVRNETTALASAIAEARKIADMPNGRSPITYQRNILNTLLPHLDHARKVTFLLELDAMAQAQDGDMKGAFRSCHAMLNAARSVGDEPLMISQLVRVACIALTMHATQRTLAQGQPDTEDLARLQQALEDEERFPRLSTCFRGERAFMHEQFDAIESGDVAIADLGTHRALRSESVFGFAERDLVRNEHPTMLTLWGHAVQIATLPSTQRAGAIEELNADMRAQGGTLTRLFWPKLSVIEDAAKRADGSTRCAITALAAERYRQDHGAFPEDLAQLVPHYLQAIPLDPQDSKPLRYYVLEDRVVIFSLCRVSTAFYDPDAPSPPGVGVAFHLFDVKHRRQPPRELLPPPVVDDANEPQ